jgi:uncharacterized protein YjbJ (UPF0337 family)
MGNPMKRVAGAAKEVGGKIQKHLGRAIGDERIEAEGAVKEVAGRAQKETAKAAERAVGMGEQIQGAVTRTAGAVSDD